MAARTLAWAALLVALAASFPAIASAIEPSDVILGFGSSYAAPDGSSCTHRGIDAAAGPGSDIESPASGSVRFAGRVPGPHGGTVGAVTLDTEHGLVSLLPLEQIRVSKGDRVDRGEPLGSAAPSGDPSSAASHMHLSLRRGDLYVDPSVLLVALPASEKEAATQPEVARRPDSAPNSAPRAATLGGVQAVTASRLPVGVTAGEPTYSSATAGAAGPAGARVVESMGEGVTLAPADVAPDAVVSVVGTAARPSTIADISATERLSRIALETGKGAVAWLRSAGTSGVVALAVGFLACFGLLGKQAFERRVASNPPVSDRLGRLLQQLRAGDTLRGLTSCSGLLPSQSRSRLAQRR